MTRYDLYTAIIGICGILFSLSIFYGESPTYFKIILIIFGMIVFTHSAYTLYKSLIDKNFATDKSARLSFDNKSISKISLLNKHGQSVDSWELYGKTSIVIGKDIGENHVDVDLSKTPYASMVDVEHAVLNYADGNWYIEDLDSRNGISIKKFGQDKAYKLSSQQPCKLDFGDVVFIGMCQFKIS